VHYNGAKAQSCIVQKFAPWAVKVCYPCRAQQFSFHFKHYNLAIRVVNLIEIFYTCSPSSLVQDPTVKILKIEKIPFLLTELEMADLSIFLRKMTFVL
jgi:hypothetical protein